MKTKLLLVIALAGCGKSEPPPAGTPAAETKPAKDPAKAKQMIAGGALVLDVRTPDEFGGGHIATATNLPIDTFGDHLGDVDKLAAGDKTKPIVVYCAHGSRAARAKKALDSAGYTNVVNGGGYDDLQ